MENSNIWCFDNLNIINEIKDYAKNMENPLFLDLNKENFDVLEKYVFETAMYHINNNNISLNDDIFIEFYFKDITNNLSINYDECKKENGNYVYPLITCITYLNENSSPLLITDIDIEKYIYKDFFSEKHISILYPKIGNQVTIDCSKIYGDYNNNILNYNLIISLWNKKPSSLDYYTPLYITKTYIRENNIINIKPDLYFKEIHVTKEIINFELFQDLLYENTYNTIEKLLNIINSEKENSNFIKIVLNEEIDKKNLDLQLKSKYGDIFDIVNDVYNDNIRINNRFLQKFIKEKIYSIDICDWICSEFDKYISNNKGSQNPKRLNNSVIDVSIENIPVIFNYFLISLKTIIDFIRKYYYLDEKIDLNITELCIVKYNYEISKDYSSSNKNNSLLTFQILLNPEASFEGGEISFDDGLVYKLNQGDLLINCSNLNYYNLPLKKGIQYILVGSISINFS
jgi:hypothetical protein